MKNVWFQVRYDIVNGIVHQWKKFLLLAIVYGVLITQFLAVCRLKHLIGQYTISDIVLYLFKGMSWITDDKSEVIIPTAYVLPNVLIAFAIGNYPFKDINAPLGTALYTLPNTPTNYNGVYVNPMKSQLTKIMVAARLAYVDDAGTVHPAEICTYKGQKFLGQDNVKTVISKEFNIYYKKTTSASGDTYTQIEPSDIVFSATVTSTSGLKLQDYQVVADLRSGLTELYYKKGGNFEQVADIATVRAEMQGVPVDISNGGKTYYYTPIKHLGKSGSVAEYGVVRNHSYQVEITSIKGFGTPVYNPDTETIAPTLPSDDQTYLAAKISVLSWRVVSSKVDLDSPK